MSVWADTLWAWVTEAPDGSVSTVGVMSALGHTPLVTVREDLALGVMREIALLHREHTGQPVWLSRFRIERVLERLP